MKIVITVHKVISEAVLIPVKHDNSSKSASKAD